MKKIEVYKDQELKGSFEIMIPEYQPVPYWYRDIRLMIMSVANERFGVDWTHTRIGEIE